MILVKRLFYLTQIILIFGMSVMPRMQVGQWAKLPLLYVHFIEHQQAEPQNDFTDFLLYHYGTDSRHADDDSGHMSLPLYQSVPGWVFVPICFQAILFEIFQSSFRVTYPPFIRFYLPPLTGEIFHPPAFISSIRVF